MDSMKPLSEPDSSSRWWWMRYRLGKRSKWKVVLVEAVIHEHVKYVKPWQDDNCYPFTFFRAWQAKFLPAYPPPASGEWS